MTFKILKTQTDMNYCKHVTEQHLVSLLPRDYFVNTYIQKVMDAIVMKSRKTSINEFLTEKHIL